MRRSSKAKRNGERKRKHRADREARRAGRAEVRHAKQFGPQAQLCREARCAVPGCRKGPPCDPHHLKSRGAGGTDADTVPLCHEHHVEIETIGRETFQAKRGVDLERLRDALRLANQGE